VIIPMTVIAHGSQWPLCVSMSKTCTITRTVSSMHCLTTLLRRTPFDAMSLSMRTTWASPRHATNGRDMLAVIVSMTGDGLAVAMNLHYPRMSGCRLPAVGLMSLGQFYRDFPRHLRQKCCIL
jgi:hypothetical protein